RLGGRKMHMVGGHDGDGLDAIRTLGFRLRHLLIGAIDAVRIEAELDARHFRLFRVGRERARNELELAVHPCGYAVHAADEGPLPAAHHTVADRAIARLDLPAADHVFLPFGSRQWALKWKAT